MTKNERVEKILNALDTEYGSEAVCYLNYDHEKPWQLLFATILSAQCTDDRVNIVTSEMFVNFPTLESYAYAPYKDVENAVKTTGLFRNKAQSLQGAAKMLLEDFSGVLPSDIESLIKLPGVGRKTANVARCHLFNDPSVVVDTHVNRITNRLGLAAETDPVKLEFALMKILPKENWARYNTQLIAHGRKVCKARGFVCEGCCLYDYCKRKV